MSSREGALPVLLGIGAVAATALLVHICYYNRKKKSAHPVTLEDSTKEYKLPLIYKEVISHDTRLYSFGLPSKEHILGLPVGQHVFLTAMVEGERECRKYTPVSNDETYGHVDLVIKVYFKDVHPLFPGGGKLTQHIDKMALGDTIDVRGPVGRLVYSAPGTFDILLKKGDPTSKVVRRARRVAMIAGGSGIAPMLQLVRQIANDPNDSTEMALLFANQSENDILLRKELDICAERHPTQFCVWYTVDKATSPSWPYSVGYITADMIRDHLFPPSDDTIVLVCGPKPMIKFACTPNLDQLGYDPTMRFKY